MDRGWLKATVQGVLEQEDWTRLQWLVLPLLCHKTLGAEQPSLWTALLCPVWVWIPWVTAPQCHKQETSATTVNQSAQLSGGVRKRPGPLPGRNRWQLVQGLLPVHECDLGSHVGFSRN